MRRGEIHAAAASYTRRCEPAGSPDRAAESHQRRNLAARRASRAFVSPSWVTAANCPVICLSPSSSFFSSPTRTSVSWRLKDRTSNASGSCAHLCLSDQLITAVDTWAAAQDDDPGRSEAIRRLVELGLTLKTHAMPASKQGRASRAHELATEAIDEMGDPAASSDERAQRRRRLTKGPEEFREVRIDRPKTRGK